MYSKFKISKSVLQSVCARIPVEIKEEKIGVEYYDILKKALVPNKDNPYLDGDTIKEWCFPRNGKTYDVFISHSFADYQDAFRLKELIESRYKLSCFVDSQVWHNAYKLLKAIDKIFCYQEKSDTYQYDARNQTTAHVYAMLSIALLEMIDKMECCILLENSKSKIDFNELKSNEYTLSPWIYEEVSFMNHIRLQEKLNRTTSLLESQRKAFSASLTMGHGIETKDFIELSSQDFPYLDQSKHWLDYLYQKYSKQESLLRDFY